MGIGGWGLGIRDPKTKDDLKKIVIEERNKFSPWYIRNQFKNFINKCKKVIKIQGARLIQEHLFKIRKGKKKENKEEEEEEEDEIEEEDENEEDENEDKENDKLKLEIVYDEKK